MRRIHLQNKIIFLVSFLFLFVLKIDAQEKVKDSLLLAFKTSVSQNEKIHNLLEIANLHFEIQNDTSIYYCNKAFDLAKLNKDLLDKYEAEIYAVLGQAYENVNKAESVLFFLKSLPLFEAKENNEKLFEVHSRLCIVYTSINKLAEAKQHLDKAVLLSEKEELKDPNFQLAFASAIYWYSSQNFGKASKAYLELIDKLKGTSKYRRISQAYLNLGACYYFLNQADSCVSACYSALKLDDQHKFMQPAFKITFLNTIAASYLKIDRIEEARKIFLQNIKIAKNAGISYSLIVAYNNYAYTCRLQKKDKDSLEALLKAFSLIEKNKYVAELLEIETGIGASYLNLNQREKALPFIRRALKSANKSKNIQLIIENNINLGDALNSYASEKYYKLALNLAEENKLLDESCKCYQKLIELASTSKNGRNVLEYHNRMLSLKDSIQSASKFKEIKEVETKYETQKKEQQIELLKTKNDNQQLSIEKSEQEKIMLVVGIAFMLLMLVPVGFYVRQRNENKLLEARINSENKESTRIAKELHDSVAGSLTTIRYLLDSGSESSVLVSNIESVSKEVRGISHKLNIGALANQGIKEAVFDALMLDQFPKDINLQINIADGFEIKDYEVRINCIRILQELVQNTLKYAEADQIKITFEYKKHCLCLSYQDNGKGFKMEKTPLGNGLKNIKDRVEYLKGTVEFDAQIGSGFYCGVTV